MPFYKHKESGSLVSFAAVLSTSIIGVVVSAVNIYKEMINLKKKCQSGCEHSTGKPIRLVTGAAIFIAGIACEVLSLDIYATVSLFIAAYAILGYKVIFYALKNIVKGRIFDENFLMALATAGAFAIGEFPEAAAVMLFYQIGEYFQGAAVRKSKRSIVELMDLRPDYANIMLDGELVKVAPDTLKAGDVIIVKAGEKIPLDGIVTDGEGTLDTKSLTGESMPRTVRPGNTVLSGCVNQDGRLTIEVTKPFGESTVAKIIELVENAGNKKARTENFITTFARFYTPVVVILAALLAVIPPLLLSGDWSEWIHRGLVFLVVSCPCALVLSIPLSFFGGIGNASRNGILVKGSEFLEALNNLDIVVFDKTGTLTKGAFEVTNVYPAEEFSVDQVIGYAAHAEFFSNHPIALSIQKAYSGIIDKAAISGYKETAGYGISVTYGSKKLLAGNEKLMISENIVFNETNDSGAKVYISVDGQYAGCIVISDELKPDSRDAVVALRSKGIREIVMLTGDNAQSANKTASNLSIDKVYSQLLPHEKVEKLEMINTSKREKGKLAFVGDGINDAPVLAGADIGVAMGGLGSDAAIEAADIVLMTDAPSKLPVALDIARATRRVVRQNIIFSLGVKAIILLLGAAGIAGMWGAVFADVGVSLIAILNAMRLLRMRF